MTVNELNVKMTKAELAEHDQGRTWGDNKGVYTKGAICSHLGKIYISQKNNNNVCPIGATCLDWKEVIIEG